MHFNVFSDVTVPAWKLHVLKDGERGLEVGVLAEGRAVARMLFLLVERYGGSVESLEIIGGNMDLK